MTRDRAIQITRRLSIAGSIIFAFGVGRSEIGVEAGESSAIAINAATVQASDATTFHKAGDPLPAWFAPSGSMKISAPPTDARFLKLDK